MWSKSQGSIFKIPRGFWTIKGRVCFFLLSGLSMWRNRNSDSLVRISQIFTIQKKKYDYYYFFLPAAISLQSSVGRHLMNYLLSEVMFTSLYIYWDSPLPPFCLRKIKLWQLSKACCSGFKKGNDCETYSHKILITFEMVQSRYIWDSILFFKIILCMFPAIYLYKYTRIIMKSLLVKKKITLFK